MKKLNTYNINLIRDFNPDQEKKSFSHQRKLLKSAILNEKIRDYIRGSLNQSTGLSTVKPNLASMCATLFVVQFLSQRYRIKIRLETERNQCSTLDFTVYGSPLYRTI